MHVKPIGGWAWDDPNSKSGRIQLQKVIDKRERGRPKCTATSKWCLANKEQKSGQWAARTATATEGSNKMVERYVGIGGIEAGG